MGAIDAAAIKPIPKQVRTKTDCFILTD